MLRPYDKLGGYVAFRAGSFGTVSLFVDVNVPLASGIGHPSPASIALRTDEGRTSL